MGLLTRVHQRSQTLPPISIKERELVDRLFGDHLGTLAGVNVSIETAFTYSAIFDAVNQISSDIAKLPLNLYKRRGGAAGGSDIYFASPVQRLVKLSPNPEMGSLIFRRQVMVWALIDHGGFAEIQRNGAGQPVALWPINAPRVQPYRERLANGTLGPLVYRIDGGRTTIQPDDMIHIRGIGLDPHCGFAMVNVARQAIGLALAAERFGASFFGNGSTFGGILSADAGQLDNEEDRNDIRKQLEGLHRGPDRAHKFAVLTGGLKYQKIGVAPNEAQMNELRTKQVEEVARFYRMPPYRLGVNTAGSVSFSSVEMAQLDYYQGALLDWVTQWEEELNRKLIPSLESRQQYIKHNANAFLRGDIKSRFEALGIARDKGIISANEWRDLEEMNPQDGEQGTLYLVQTAQTPADRIGPMADAQIAKTEAETKKINNPPPPPPTPAPDAGPAVKDANARADAAEAIATEARGKVEHLVASLAVAEAAGEAAKADVEPIREQLRQESAKCAQLTLLADELRRDAVRAADQSKADGERAVAAEAQREAAERDRDAALVRADAEQAAAALAQAEATEQTRQAASARAEMATATAAREAAERDRDAATAQASEASRLATEAEARASLAATTLEQAQGDTAAVRAELAAATQALTEARAHADTQAQEVSRLTTAVESAATAEREAEQRVTRAESRVTLANEAEATAKREQAGLKTAQAEAIAATIAAHRALMVDVMRRMIERETERLQTRAHLPSEKLTEAIDKFYDGHEDLCRRALVPVLRVHLAFVRSAEDPAALADELTRAHIAESRRQIQAVIDGDAESVPSALAALFRRWDTERVATVADALMQKELDYARTR